MGNQSERGQSSGLLTLVRLSIGDLQIEIVALADLLLVQYLLLQFADGDVQTIEGHFISIFAAFEPVVHRHVEGSLAG